MDNSFKYSSIAKSIGEKKENLHISRLKTYNNDTSIEKNGKRMNIFFLKNYLNLTSRVELIDCISLKMVKDCYYGIITCLHVKGSGLKRTGILGKNKKQ